MSWSLGFNAESPEKVAEEFKKAADASLTAQPYDSWDDDIQEQLDLAAKNAESAAKTLTGQGGPIYVAASGHRKRGEADVENLSINVTRQPKPKS